MCNSLLLSRCTLLALVSDAKEENKMSASTERHTLWTYLGLGKSQSSTIDRLHFWTIQKADCRKMYTDVNTCVRNLSNLSWGFAYYRRGAKNHHQTTILSSQSLRDYWITGSLWNALARPMGQNGLFVLSWMLFCILMNQCTIDISKWIQYVCL